MTKPTLYAKTYQEILDIVVASILIVTVTIGYILCFRTRDYYLFSKRPAVFLHLNPLCAILWGYTLFLRDLGFIPCQLWTILKTFITVFYSFSWIYTGLFIFIRFQLSAIKIQDRIEVELSLIDAEPEPETKTEEKASIERKDAFMSSWAFRNRRFVGDKWQLFLLTIWVLFYVIIYFIIILAHKSDRHSFSLESYDPNADECTFTDDTVTLAILFIMTASAIIFFAILFHRTLRGQRDGLGTKRDAKVAVITWSIGFTIFIISVITVTRTPGLVAVTLSFLISFWLSHGWCLVSALRDRSYRFAKTRKSMRRDSSEDAETDVEDDRRGSDFNATFEEVLRDNSLRLLFLEFLKGEWSTENLLFLDELQTLDNIIASQGEDENRDILIKEINDIYKKFFLEDAVLQLNLDEEAKKAVRNGISSIDTYTYAQLKTFYQSAEGLIRELLRFDSFVRFKNSNLWPNEHPNRKQINS